MAKHINACKITILHFIFFIVCLYIWPSEIFSNVLADVKNTVCIIGGYEIVRNMMIDDSTHNPTEDKWYGKLMDGF